MKRFGKLVGSSVLMLASLFMVASLFSCGDKSNKPGGNTVVTEKFDVTFVVEPADMAGKATLIAKVGKDVITKSPAKIEKNKEVVFELKITDKGYEWDKWECDALTDKTATGAKLKVTKATKVVAKLKKKENKHTVTFVADPEGKGTFTAKLKDDNTPVVSGGKVEAGKKVEVTFTLKDANADAFDSWEANDSNLEFSSISQLTTEFTMINKDVVITALTSPKGGGGTELPTVELVSAKIGGKDLVAPAAPATNWTVTVPSTTTTVDTNNLTEVKIKYGETTPAEALAKTEYTIADGTGLQAGTTKTIKLTIKDKADTYKTATFNIAVTVEAATTTSEYKVTFGVNEVKNNAKVVAWIPKVGGAPGEKTWLVSNTTPVPAGTEVTFMFNINNPFNGDKYELEKWTATGITAPAGKSASIKLTMPANDIAVTAHIVKKLPAAYISDLKIVKVASGNAQVYAITATELQKADLTKPIDVVLPYGTTDKCKFVVTANPSGANVAYDPQDAGTDTGIEFNGTAKLVTVTVGTADTHKQFTYKFNVSVAQGKTVKLTTLKVADKDLTEEQLEEALQAGGLELLVKSPCKIEWTNDSDFTVTQTPTNLASGTPLDLTAELTEVKLEVKLTADATKKVTYTLKLHKDDGVAPALEELKFEGVAFTTAPTADETNAPTVDLKSDGKITWKKVGFGVKVEVSIKEKNEAAFGDAEDVTADSEYEISLPEEASKLPVTVKITVTKNDKTTTYFFKVKK